jgi:hypothetical protein
LTWKQWLAMPLAAVASYPLGVYFGQPFYMKPAYGSLFGGVGLICAASYAMVGSVRRLQGVDSNEAEVSKFQFRTDIHDYQVRVEPFRKISKEEEDEISRNPRF